MIRVALCSFPLASLLLPSLVLAVAWPSALAQAQSPASDDATTASTQTDDATSASTEATDTEATDTAATDTEATDGPTPPTTPTPTTATAPADSVSRFAWTPAAEAPPDTDYDLHRPGIPWAFEPGMHVIGEYALTQPDGADWFHEFRLPRAWAWLGFRFENARGRVLLEAARGSGDGSLFGVAGDSLVVRFREAWVGYRAWDMLELRAGLVPTVAVNALTQLWLYRAVTQIALRQFDLMTPADLGATLTFDIPDGWGRISAAYYDGDGYTSRELNRGKTLEVFAQIHPLRFAADLAPLTLTLAYQNGSVGTGAARSDRFVGGLAWDSRVFGIGAEGGWIGGIRDRGDREGALVSGWARLELFDRLLLSAYAMHFFRDLTSGRDQLTVLTGAVGVRVVEPLRAFVAFDGRLADDVAQAADPGTRGWTLRVIVEGVFGGHFEGVVTP